MESNSRAAPQQIDAVSSRVAEVEKLTKEMREQALASTAAGQPLYPSLPNTL